MDWLSFHVTALLLAAAAFGGMLLFMICVAPSVFTALEKPAAAALMRHLFPRYYFTLAVGLAAAAGFLVPAASYAFEVILLGGAAVMFFALRQWLLPRIERARESDPGEFKRWHRVSVTVHLVQLAAVTVALVRLAQ